MKDEDRDLLIHYAGMVFFLAYIALIAAVTGWATRPWIGWVVFFVAALGYTIVVASDEDWR